MGVETAKSLLTGVTRQQETRKRRHELSKDKSEQPLWGSGKLNS